MAAEWSLRTILIPTFDVNLSTGHRLFSVVDSEYIGQEDIHRALALVKLEIRYFLSFRDDAL